MDLYVSVNYNNPNQYQILDKYPERIVEIIHEDVKVKCHSEQIAFFGKIFAIINERIRFQNYNEEIYKNLKQNYSPFGTIISQIQRMINSNDILLEDQSIKTSKQSKLIYKPKKLTLYLKMTKLQHIITVEGFNYTRFRNLNEMSHEISINKIGVQYKNFKEFAINDFKLTFSQTTIQQQLSMAISQITMQQNQQTLKDYLDSFTLFKHLLQFESNEKSKPTKLFKKFIFIDIISLHFQHQLAVLKSLKIDKQSNPNELMNSLYFTIERCQIILSKEKHKESIKQSYANHILFSIDSLSLRENQEQRNGKIKPKTTIIIKNPNFSLPSANVSKIISAYIQIYSRLETHIQAFLINVTNQKLKSLKYHFKQFFIEPNQLNIIITGLQLSICDTKLDKAMIAFNKTVRQHLSTQQKYNEAEILSILKRNSKVSYPLIIVKVAKISFENAPIKNISPNQKIINYWIETFQTNTQQQASNNIGERNRKIKAELFNLKLKKITVNIRDYESPILSIAQIRSQAQRLKITKIFGRKINYLKCQLKLGELNMSIGLGQLSGWKQIGKRLTQLNVNSKRKLKIIQEDSSIWHRLTQKWKWKLAIQKQSVSKIHILSGHTPYNGDYFLLQINKLSAESTKRVTNLRIKSLSLQLKGFNILEMPELQVGLQVKPRQAELDIFLSVRMQKDICHIKIPSWIIQFLEGLVQLKKDWLLIFGIFEKDIEKNVLQFEEIQNMTYLEIANLLSQKDFAQDTTSIINYLNHFQFKFYATQISIGIVQHNLQLSLQAHQLQTFTLLQPDHDLYNQFKVRRSKINTKQLKLSYIKTYYDQNGMATNLKSQINDKAKLSRAYDFLRCDSLVINFNWYFSQGKKMGLANQWIYAHNLTGQISKKMQRYSQKMAKLLTYHKMDKREKHQVKYQQPISKLRRAVLQIIQINRRKMIKEGHIKKYKTVIELQSYRLFLRSNDDKMMILQGKQKAQFYQRIQYGDDDKYHSIPSNIITARFPASKILLSSGENIAHQFEIMRAGAIVLDISMSDSYLDQGKCSVQNVQIEIQQFGKNILQQLSIFIVDLVNTADERQRVYNIETTKYEQLVNIGRQKLKQKIQWRQTDIKWKEKEVFQWNFTLNKLSLVVSMSDSKLCSIQIDKTQMALHLYDNHKILRKIQFSNIRVINQLEPQNSDYRKIVQLGRNKIGLEIISCSYQVFAYSNVSWKYHKQLFFWLQPMQLKMTQELLQTLVKFMRTENVISQQFGEYDQIKEYQSKIPDYYKAISIDPITLQLWFRSSNLLKRLEAIKLKLQKYELKQKLLTKKELIREFGFWTLKQVGSQIFSLLGQKIFGDFEEEQEHSFRHF